MNKEYTYDIDKYTIGVDENGEGGIGLTVAIIKNGEINFLGNYYGENARCIDLLIKENQELKDQLENWNNKFKIAEEIINIQKQDGNYNYDEYSLGMYNGMEYIASLFRINEPKIICSKDVKFINNKTQQKEFIKYLEYKIDICDSFLDTIKSDLQEISYRVMSANKTYITTQIKENEIAHKVYEEILQKYKSIIGGNIDE